MTRHCRPRRWPRSARRPVASPARCGRPVADRRRQFGEERLGHRDRRIPDTIVGAAIGPGSSKCGRRQAEAGRNAIAGGQAAKLSCFAADHGVVVARRFAEPEDFDLRLNPDRHRLLPLVSLPQAVPTAKIVAGSFHEHRGYTAVALPRKGSPWLLPLSRSNAARFLRIPQVQALLLPPFRRRDAGERVIRTEHASAAARNLFIRRSSRLLVTDRAGRKRDRDRLVWRPRRVGEGLGAGVENAIDVGISPHVRSST
jgi:hypothetical protein